MKIFLVAGKAGSGKNEIAKMIKEYYVYKLNECAITSYSKYIKLFAQELTNWDGFSEKPRDFMQKIGDDIRNINSEFFTTRMIEDIQVYEKYVQALVISDVRLPEEIERIKETYDDVTSFYVVNQFGKSKLTIEQQSHITETALEIYEEFDYIITNETKEVLHDKIFKILEDIDGTN